MKKSMERGCRSAAGSMRTKAYFYIQHQHRAILEAVADCQPERAMQLLADHIQTSLRERLDAFDHWERENSLRETIPEFLDLSMIADTQ